MTQKKIIIFEILAVFSLAAIFFGVLLLNRLLNTSIDSERMNQLNEMTIQVSDTFNNALSFHQSCAVSAEQLLASGEYGSSDDITETAGKISAFLNLGDGNKLVFIDKIGYCYDKDGKKGIWGDFDRISGIDGNYTFISDSVTYDGVYWAFAEKLENSVKTSDGDVEIAYAVLLSPVETMDGYYINKSYKNVGETYILKENGTRMYDDIKPDDTIAEHNIYKKLRESENGYGDSFDGVLENLKENGTASGIYMENGEKYCYSLAWNQKNGVVILYLIPALQVASGTYEMISVIMRVIIAIAIVIIILSSSLIYIFSKLQNNRMLSAQKEMNMREIERMNVKLSAMNASLNDANKAAQSALAVAQSANRAKSSFLSNMSHDIRTPLNAILGFQKLISISTSNPAKVKEYSDKIALSGNHLLALINDILDMSRIESGKTVLSSDAFNLQTAMDELKTLTATQMQAKHQTFVVENEVGELYIFGDRARLAQILTNLLSNAVKYTPDGGKIELIARRLPAKGERIALIRFAGFDVEMEISF